LPARRQEMPATEKDTASLLHNLSGESERAREIGLKGARSPISWGLARRRSYHYVISQPYVGTRRVPGIEEVAKLFTGVNSLSCLWYPALFRSIKWHGLCYVNLLC
jgi:hypothetical protein